VCVCVCVYALCREENIGCIKLAQTCERIWAVKLLALPRNIRKVAGSVTDQDTDCCLPTFCVTSLLALLYTVSLSGATLQHAVHISS